MQSVVYIRLVIRHPNLPRWFFISVNSTSVGQLFVTWFKAWLRSITWNISIMLKRPNKSIKIRMIFFIMDFMRTNLTRYSTRPIDSTYSNHNLKNILTETLPCTVLVTHQIPAFNWTASWFDSSFQRKGKESSSDHLGFTPRISRLRTSANIHQTFEKHGWQIWWPDH